MNVDARSACKKLQRNPILRVTPGKRGRHREIHSRPGRELRRRRTRYLRCERNSVVRIRPQVGMGLEVLERVRDLGREDFAWDLLERKPMSLAIPRVDDFVEAHEIADERQVFAMACLLRMSECPGNDVAKLADVAQVNTAHGWIDGKSPAQGSIRLLLGRKSAHEVLVVHRRDDERVIRR